MKVIPATEAKNRFGELLEAAILEPVEIAKNGRTVAVVVSVDTYRNMQRSIQESATSPNFKGLSAWRKSAKKRMTSKPMDEADYSKHLTEKYGR
jgi:prevent-host-death family protein